MKTLDEWFFEEEEALRNAYAPHAKRMIIPPILVRMAWEYQQKIINDLKSQNGVLKKENQKLRGMNIRNIKDLGSIEFDDGLDD